jgi:hypothetical protein
MVAPVVALTRRRPCFGSNASDGRTRNIMPWQDHCGRVEVGIGPVEAARDSHAFVERSAAAWRCVINFARYQVAMVA